MECILAYIGDTALRHTRTVMRKGMILNEQLTDREWVQRSGLLLFVLKYVNSWLWSCYIYGVSDTWTYSNRKQCNCNTGFVTRGWQTTLKIKGKATVWSSNDDRKAMLLNWNYMRDLKRVVVRFVVSVLFWKHISFCATVWRRIS